MHEEGDGLARLNAGKQQCEAEIAIDGGWCNHRSAPMLGGCKSILWSAL